MILVDKGPEFIAQRLQDWGKENLVLIRHNHSVHPSTPAAPLRALFMRSPSQCPGTVRVATSAGRSANSVMLGICPRRSVPRDRGQPIVQGARRHGVIRTVPLKSSQPRGVSAYRQDPLETASNLFGRMAMEQLSLHIPPQPGIPKFSRPPSHTSPASRKGLGSTRPIRPTGGCVAGLLPNQRTRCSA